MSRRLAAALGLLAALAPATAQACAVCGGGNPANRTAFYLSTLALSALPLGLFATGLLWLRSRLGGRLAEEFAERDAGATSPPRPVAAASNLAPDSR